MEIIAIGILLLVVFLVVGFALVGLAFHLFWWLLVGLVVGALARLVLPGEQPIGLGLTALFGAVGSLLGGIVAHGILHGGALAQLLLSVAIAAVLVTLASGSSSRSTA
jgi:uncharacterized membrane protein YeaQ/YmgE (transglycosylase-associated protein family)